MSAWHGAYAYPKPTPVNFPTFPGAQYRAGHSGAAQSLPPVPNLANGKVSLPATKQLTPNVDLQADYQKLFGTDGKSSSQGARQLKPTIKINMPSSMPPQSTASKPLSARKEASSRWDKEPAEPQDKVKELQQTLTAAERKNNELQAAVVEAESRVESYKAREIQMNSKLASANASFTQLKTDYEVLKAEAVYVHQELQVILDENDKLKALGTHSEEALLQAAAALRSKENRGDARAPTKAQDSGADELKTGATLAELTAKQAEIDAIKPQIEQLKSQLSIVKEELRSKENQLKETMVFNKKSMSVTTKLNECVKTQEKQIAELKWNSGMHQNELKEKALKLEALQAQLAHATTAPKPPTAVPSPAVTAELAAKEEQIKQLREKLQESAQTISRLKESVSVNSDIGWNEPKLTASAKEYLAEIALYPGRGISGTKRKLALEEPGASEEDRGVVQLSKRALRGVAGGEIFKEVDQAMSEQQGALAKAQRTLHLHQNRLREAQGKLETNRIRKRCLEARSKVLREQGNLVAKIASEVESACLASEEAVAALKEQTARLSAEVERRRAELVETQIGATELQVEARVRERATES